MKDDELCCATPNLYFKWYLGFSNVGEVILMIDAIECKSCASTFSFDEEKCPNRGVTFNGRAIRLQTTFTRPTIS